MLAVTNTLAVATEKGWDVSMSRVKEDVDCCTVSTGIVKEPNYAQNDGTGVNVPIEHLTTTQMTEK